MTGVTLCAYVNRQQCRGQILDRSELHPCGGSLIEVGSGWDPRAHRCSRAELDDAVMQEWRSTPKSGPGLAIGLIVRRVPQNSAGILHRKVAANVALSHC